MLIGGRSFSGRERNVLYLNTRGAGSERFADASAVSGWNVIDDTRAVCATDWDFDGDPDFFTVNRTSPQVRFLRNDAPAEGAFLALRLVGRTCNRDAIGARVEVRLAGAPPLVRSLRAGEGFLGQSTKWLHFGLGPDPVIESVTVRWPGGSKEEIHGAAPGGHWVVEQGTGKAVAFDQPPRLPDLAGARFAAVPEETSRRCLFSTRIPLPPMPVQDQDGRTALLNDRLPGGPLLVNLWASWCRACSAELRDFASRASDLKAAGLSVLALNIERAKSGGRNDPERAQQFLQEIAWPFESGWATPEALDRLEGIDTTFFGRQSPLPLPCSVLVDAEGRLRAYYQGPVRVDDLLRDLDVLPLAKEEAIARSLPFPGRWHKLRLISPVKGLGDRLFLEGAEDHAARFYREALAIDADDAQAMLGLGVILVQQGQIQEAFVQLSRGRTLQPDEPAFAEQIALVHQLQGRFDSAEREFRAALELDAEQPEVHLDLGNLYRLRNQPGRAVEEYRRAIELAPDHAEAHASLGVVYATLRRIPEAEKSFREAVRLQPNAPEPLYNLGGMLAAQGKAAEALQALEAVLRIRPDYPGAADGVKWCRDALKRQEESGSRPK